MAEYVTTKITGLAELQTNLEALPEKMARTGLKNALRAGAAYVRSMMVANAPKETGFMAEHFDVKLRMRGDALAGSAFIGPNSKALYPGRKSNWASRTARLVAGWLEFGTKDRPKNPFMTQAWEGSKEGALAEIIDDLRETLGKL
jgi:HK97 gp10 family phage protein